MYIQRHSEKTIHTLSKMFGAVLVTGPRQAGKTALLKEVTSGIPYITLDAPILLTSAVEQCVTFFKEAI